MTLLQHVEALEGFQALSEEKLPISQSYKLAKIINDLKSIVDPFFAIRQEHIQKIRDEHADSGQEIPEEAIKGFQAQVQSMLEETVDSVVEPFDISALQCDVPAKTLSMCMPFIKVEADAAVEGSTEA